jgi:hypothetical protein
MADKLNLESLLVFMLSDIDINLLQNEEQTGDNDQEHYTKKEIRKQLSSTGGKFVAVLKELGYDIKKPLLNEITN